MTAVETPEWALDEIEHVREKAEFCADKLEAANQPEATDEAWVVAWILAGDDPFETVGVARTALHTALTTVRRAKRTVTDDRCMRILHEIDEDILGLIRALGEYAGDVRVERGEIDEET